MRTHKFRAWDRKAKRWMSHEESSFLFLNFYVDGSGKFQIDETDPMKDNAISDADSNYDIVDYIGRKDRYGIEIYEGHIVNYGDNFPSVVIWDELAVGETPGFWLKEIGDYEHPRYHTMTAYTNPIEILGHIFENPELPYVKKGEERT